MSSLFSAYRFSHPSAPGQTRPAAQAAIDAKTANMVIYQFNTCPFCVKVRRVMHKHALNIELRDAQNDLTFKEELTSKGGKHKVPCLRLENGAGEVKWLYESDNIEGVLKLA